MVISKNANLSTRHSLAGKAGAAARWGQTPRKTKTVRAYDEDAEALARRVTREIPTIADVIHRLLAP